MDLDFETDEETTNEEVPVWVEEWMKQDQQHTSLYHYIVHTCITDEMFRALTKIDNPAAGKNKLPMNLNIHIINRKQIPQITPIKVG